MERSLLLDLLRILAIALVFVAHFGQLADHAFGDFFGVKNFYYVSLGGVGVSVFLVLSGLLAGLSDGPRQTPYVTYMLKKILRIYPLYWLSVPLSMLGYWVGERVLEGRWPELFPNGVITDLIGSATGFYSWIGLWGGPYNSPSWFIALIMVMYAFFPALYYFIRKKPYLSLLILALVSGLSRWYVGQEGLPFSSPSLYDGIKGWFYRQYGFMPGRPGDWFPPCRLFEFGLGVYLAVAVPRQFWFSLKAKFTTPITYLSDLAFPLFLIHYPFLFLIPYLETWGLSFGKSLIGFLVLLIPVCHFVSRIDAAVPRKKIALRLGT